MSPPILSPPRSNANSADGGGGGAAAAGVKKPVGKLTRYTIFVCVAAAFGGLTFGYDIGVSGGVTSNRDFLKMVKEKRGERGRHRKSSNCWRRGRGEERGGGREETSTSKERKKKSCELFLSSLLAGGQEAEDGQQGRERASGTQKKLG